MNNENLNTERKSVSMKDFIEKYGATIKEKVRNSFEPIYQNDQHDEWDKANLQKLATLKRRPFSAQADTILAVAKSLFKADNKSALLIGEMGTGKTLMGTAISTLIPKVNSRIMVMCPSHLVSKWAREIRETDPHATDVRILTSVGDVNLSKPNGREYWVVSKERAKLHYAEKNGVEYKREMPHCPDCASKLVDEDSVINGVECAYCGAQLFSADNSKFRRYAIAEYIKRHKKYCNIDLLLLDECHELKSGSTAQGQAMHALVVSAKKTIGLTGTLMGGYASNLYYLLFRMFTRKMKAHGFEHNSSTEFSKRYGVVEEVLETKESSDRTASMRSNSKRTKISEKPGISPLLLPHFLLESSIYLWISDISDELPSYSEECIGVDMELEQADVHNKFQKELMCHVQRALSKKDTRLLGAMVNSLFALPDGVRRGEVVYEPLPKGVDKNIYEREVLCYANPVHLDLSPKEERLRELVLAEKAKGRKCAIFLEHTGTRDLIPDLSGMLEDVGVKPLILRSETVPSAKREEWLKKRIKSDNPDVLICNPNLVKTGLDLLEFPTIIYFQTGMSIYTLRQSSRRSWRIGQRKPVKVYFMAYNNTAQERALKLMAAKLETSNAVEGKLSADGLSAMSESDSSMVIALARSLMGEESDKRGLGDVWQSYRQSDELVNGNGTATFEEEVEKVVVNNHRRTAEIFTIEDYLDMQGLVEQAYQNTNKPQISVFDLLDAMG